MCRVESACDERAGAAAPLCAAAVTLETDGSVCSASNYSATVSNVLCCAVRCGSCGECGARAPRQPGVEERAVAHEVLPRAQVRLLHRADRPIVQVAVDDHEVSALFRDNRRVAHAVLVDERQLTERLARVCNTEIERPCFLVTSVDSDAQRS